MVLTVQGCWLIGNPPGKPRNATAVEKKSANVEKTKQTKKRQGSSRKKTIMRDGLSRLSTESTVIHGFDIGGLSADISPWLGLVQLSQATAFIEYLIVYEHILRITVFRVKHVNSGDGQMGVKRKRQQADHHLRPVLQRLEKSSKHR